MKKKTKAEWRVAIARDVVAQLDAEAMIARAGTYFTADHDQTRSIRWGERDPLLVDQATLKAGVIKPCRVCMVGGLFIAAVRVANKFSKDLTAVRPSDIFEKVSEFFPARYREALESAFETWGTAMGRMERFENLDDETRMRFLARMIIRTKGRVLSLRQVVAEISKKYPPDKGRVSY